MELGTSNSWGSHATARILASDYSSFRASLNDLRRSLERPETHNKVGEFEIGQLVLVLNHDTRAIIVRLEAQGRVARLPEESCRLWSLCVQSLVSKRFPERQTATLTLESAAGVHVSVSRAHHPHDPKNRCEAGDRAMVLGINGVKSYVSLAELQPLQMPPRDLASWIRSYHTMSRDCCVWIPGEKGGGSLAFPVLCMKKGSCFWWTRFLWGSSTSIDLFGAL